MKLPDYLQSLVNTLSALQKAKQTENVINLRKKYEKHLKQQKESFLFMYNKNPESKVAKRYLEIALQLEGVLNVSSNI